MQEIEVAIARIFCCYGILQPTGPPHNTTRIYCHYYFLVEILKLSFLFLFCGGIALISLKVDWYDQLEDFFLHLFLFVCGYYHHFGSCTIYFPEHLHQFVCTIRNSSTLIFVSSYTSYDGNLQVTMHSQICQTFVMLPLQKKLKAFGIHEYRSYDGQSTIWFQLTQNNGISQYMSATRLSLKKNVQFPQEPERYHVRRTLYFLAHVHIHI